MQLHRVLRLLRLLRLLRVRLRVCSAEPQTAIVGYIWIGTLTPGTAVERDHLPRRNG